MPIGGTLAWCDPFDTPLTSHWTGAAIIVQLPSVRRLNAQEWHAYRDVRLRALRDSPNAFGSTFEIESVRTDDDWAARLAAGADSALDCPMVAEHDGAIVGLAWGRVEPATPNTVHVYQMWVDPAIRGLGLGGMLLVALVDWARTANAQFMRLSVTCGDSPALRLYTRAGFLAVGNPVPLRPGATEFVQPMQLRLP